MLAALACVALALIACAWAAHARHLLRKLATADQRVAEAQCDGLTGLLNHGAWSQAARDAYATSNDSTIVFVDLDHFKAVNDDLGHDAGDRVLRAAATSLTTVLGAADGDAVVGRIGGDEFAAVVTGIRAGADGEAQLAHLHAMVADALADASAHPQLGASLGAVCIAAAQRPGLDNVVRAADRLMYMAKRSDANLSVLAAAA